MYQSSSTSSSTLPTSGTLELMAQELVVSWLDQRNQRHSCNVLLPGSFLGNGKASTIFAAVEGAFPALSVPNLVDMASRIKHIGNSHVPDEHPSNKRMRTATSDKLVASANVFTNMQPGCVVHGLHNVMEAVHY